MDLAHRFVGMLRSDSRLIVCGMLTLAGLAMPCFVSASVDTKPHPSTERLQPIADRGIRDPARTRIEIIDPSNEEPVGTVLFGLKSKGSLTAPKLRGPR